ncbi:hypothetical protein KY285_010948 [Solanum tuberosum]|nr:hypothetical protein KY289_011517 [Solanum tuberosum]KAH0735241.1 hypothetical protein KY285_010948 [Solanum tuberosum]
MGNGLFLFEFALKVTTEQVIEGDWEWRNNPVILQWWNPTIGTRCRRSKENSAWVIGDFYGGWVETEEETQLRNHLKWARIRIKGDGADLPREVTIDGGGICYMMQICAELLVRVFAGEDLNSEVSTQRSRGGKPLGKGKVPLQSQKVIVTAGRARVVTEACGQSSKSNEIVGRGEPNSKQSPILRLGSEQNKEGGLGESLKGLSGIKELATQFLQAYNKWETSSMVENTDISAHKNRESVSKTKEAVELICNKAKGIDHSKDFGENSGIHDTEPVSIQNPRYHTDGKIEASSWVKSHNLELSKTYEVAFEGLREETHALLMKLDERKSVMEKKGANSAVSTPRHRGIGKNELKNL